jgi:hypothetical protein
MKKRIILLLLIVNQLFFFAGCALTDPRIDDFDLRINEFQQKLSLNFNNTPDTIPKFKYNRKMMDDAVNVTYSRFYSSTYQEVDIFIYTIDGTDTIKLVTRNNTFGNFLKLANALIDTIEDNVEAPNIKLQIWLGSASSSKYYYTSGVNIPTTETGVSDFSKPSWIFTVSPKVQL